MQAVLACWNVQPLRFNPFISHAAAAAASGLLPNAEVALSTMGVCLNINAWM
jgi:hypothetical protein